MRQVVATIKIFPKSVEVDLNELKKSIQNAFSENISVYKFDEEPIAFGLVVLIASILLPEESGLMDQIEETIRKVKNVSEIEVIMVRRI